MQKMIMGIIFIQMFLGACNTSSPTPISVVTPTEAPDPHLSTNQGSMYEPGVSGRAATADGIPYSFQSFTSRDGVGISVRVEHYPSKARADRAFLRYIRQSTELLENGRRLKDGARKIGKRAVFSWKDEQSKKDYVRVQWIESFELYIIESPSLEDALKFEKWYLKLT
jgi:hypothetical protein